MEDERKAEDDSTVPSKAGLAGAKLKLAAHYAMLGFAPVVAVIALVVALVASRHQSAPVQHDESAARLENLNRSLTEAKDEVDSLKIALARERSLREEESKKADARDRQIIQAVSSLQEKMKIAPTLESQLREDAHIPLATPVAALVPSAPVAVSAPAVVEKKPIATPPAHSSPTAAKKPAVPAPVHAPASSTKKPATTAPAPVHNDKKPAAPVTAKKDEGKTSAQVKAMKEAIEKFNKQ